ncbi:hypothetical protein TNCV_3603061 [Trichonephila clavipes]|nr:hypothetical protein TNCV_3603061 [Trichonephila clavipes]
MGNTPGPGTTPRGVPVAIRISLYDQHICSSLFAYEFILIPRDTNRKGRLPAGFVFTKLFLQHHLSQDCQGGVFQNIRNSLQHHCQLRHATSGRNFKYLLWCNLSVKGFLFHACVLFFSCASQLAATAFATLHSCGIPSRIDKLVAVAKCLKTCRTEIN